jgi:hypothetical protein
VRRVAQTQFYFAGGTEFEHGFFDKDSFIETLNNWAKTVVTGRARLGGIPCAVIAVETRSVECIHPADPANPDTETTVRCRNIPSLAPTPLLISTDPLLGSSFTIAHCLCSKVMVVTRISYLPVVKHSLLFLPVEMVHCAFPLPVGDQSSWAGVVS